MFVIRCHVNQHQSAGAAAAVVAVMAVMVPQRHRQSKVCPEDVENTTILGYAHVTQIGTDSVTITGPQTTTVAAPVVCPSVTVTVCASVCLLGAVQDMSRNEIDSICCCCCFCFWLDVIYIN